MKVMKITKMKNIIVLAALIIFAPALSLAQQTFGSGPWNDSYGEPYGESDDDKGTGEIGAGITFQGFGEENPGPLGSGIAILVASAAGYTIIKKRKNNKSTESINN